MSLQAERQRLLAEGEEHWHARRLEDARRLLEACNALFDPLERETHEYATFANQFGALQFDLGRLAEAESLFKTGLRGAREPKLVALLQANLGNVYRATQEFDRSSDHYERALKLLRDVDDTKGVAHCLIGLALVEFSLGHVQKAQARLQDLAPTGPDALDDPEVRWSYEFQCAKIDLHYGRSEAARAHAEKALACASEIAEPQMLRDTLYLLAKTRETGPSPTRSQERASPGASAPTFIGAALSFDKVEALTSGAVPTVMLRMADQAFVVDVPGLARAVVIEGGAPDLFRSLEQHGGFDTSARPAWIQWARESARLGISVRARGDQVEAYQFQRFALFVAARVFDPDGVSVVTWNIWLIREAIRYLTVRAQGPRHNQVREIDRPHVEQYARAAVQTLVMLRQDARDVLALLGVGRRLPKSGSTRFAHALYRLALVAEDENAQAATLEILMREAADANDVIHPLLAATDGITQLEIKDVLVSEPGPLNSYRELRRRLPEALGSTVVSDGVEEALRHLCFLRLKATSAGGVRGHELARDISTFVLRIGRDLIELQKATGQVTEEVALQTTETTLAKAFADSLCRAHGVWRVPREFHACVERLTGTINACEVVTVEEIRSLARSREMAFLYFLRSEAGYFTWLVSADGVTEASASDPSPHLAQLVESMATWAGSTDAHERRNAATAVEAALAAMYAALLPPAIRQPLGRLDRVAIIADPSLNDIPFCALRSPDGSYLVEDLEISFIPSVTGLLTLESGLGRRTRSGMSEPLVIGLSSFPGTYAQLPPLPYAAAEANMVAECLGLSGPLRPEDATRAVFLERGRAARVIHLATHAVVNECSPELSFLALADGPLSVRDLYLHSNSQSLGSTLVVLSACETARGTSRGDSVASLTNALLVAGASTVVSPVWPIVDQASAAFMERFYLELEGGTDVPAALRSAQLKLLAKERSSNPLYWAAFRVTGCRESPFAAPSQ